MTKLRCDSVQGTSAPASFSDIVPAMATVALGHCSRAIRCSMEELNTASDLFCSANSVDIAKQELLWDVSPEYNVAVNCYICCSFMN